MQRYTSFADWCADALRERGWTPKEAAKALGVTPGRWYQIQRQAYATPATAWRLERLWNVRIPERLVRS